MILSPFKIKIGSSKDALSFNVYIVGEIKKPSNCKSRQNAFSVFLEL